MTVYAAIETASLLGTLGHRLVVEIHVGVGIPGFTVVGLPDESCRESRDRVRAALLSSGLPWPNRRVTVNLLGGSERKGGAGVDLAIAVGLLVAQGEIEPDSVAGRAFVAELGLDGTLRPTPGLAPLVAAVADREVIVSAAASSEARIAGPRVLRAISDVAQLVACLRGETAWPDPAESAATASVDSSPDLADVRGHAFARAALEVAAAGWHHLFMVGPPGAGKSMLARRLPGLLPPLDEAQSLEVAMVRSAAGDVVRVGSLERPPFRAPHHSSSMVAMVGGGTAHLRPGEVSLATHGVLFLDEMGEFAPSVLDALRQPLEEGTIRIARARRAVELPARFLLVAAANPCPCGDARPDRCECTHADRQRYRRRFGGPLLDRFDIRVNIARPDADSLVSAEPGESTLVVAARVLAARSRARQRQGVANSALDADALEIHAPLDGPAQTLLRAELEAGRLSARGYHRVRRVARTVADLRGDGDVLGEDHVAVALALRAPAPGVVMSGRR